ncbi:shikimate dehydrogenase [Methylobacter tundripaludum]|uniref:Shikimate dehydrogenase (NADP(+)) n=1 Tax=Methylobacter tundripaludum (strain ATCC BAA-1195 / DSM 17260 / SV96) TaxID=697282 RepID=G3IR29_METTV|nr:shikimate dehydrogenase [Methylobacter tundripaludum]EGW23676.1 Shikimate dehydrogenase [Methylobacter tundripaludum SV96]
MTLIDRYAVFGHPIRHSKSPRIHRLFAEQTGQALEYTAVEVPAELFQTAVAMFFAEGGKGLNCTVPLKELAWRYADRKTERAQLSKAVNTLALQPDGSLLGDNTDGIGLVTDLLANHAIALSGIRILILGAGGASRGIIAPILEQSPQTLVIANRTVDKAVKLAAEFHGKGPISGCGYDALENRQFDLILNATSASLSGQLPPLPDGLLAAGGNCYDLAYGNEPTAFVRWGLENHAVKSLDGLGMLVEQAAEAFFIWRGVRPQTRPVIELLNSERQA